MALLKNCREQFIGVWGKEFHFSKAFKRKTLMW